MPINPPSTYDREHLRNLSAYGREIEGIYLRAAERAALLVNLAAGYSPGKPFNIKDYPAIKARIDTIARELQSSLQAVVLNGINAQWTLANNKNSELSRRVFGDNIGRLTTEQYDRYFSTNHKAQQAFLQRKTAGLNLSDKVWRYSEQYKQEIELALETGLRSGKSADRMTADLRQYLRNPDKLFRRVKDDQGMLRLSKASKIYHPGQGVYRSSYKNALRLTATEGNLAYRTADHLRWQQLDFVVGIEIRLSNNHTLNGVPFTDICDDLAGKYPKDFKFTGWHPFCRCNAIPILKTEAEIEQDNDRIDKGRNPTTESQNKVNEPPGALKQWTQKNKERIANATSLPYFMRDNKKYF